MAPREEQNRMPAIPGRVIGIRYNIVWNIVNLAVSKAEGSLVKVSKCTATVQYSTVNITNLPFNSSTPVIKSKVLWDHGQHGIGSG